jgi:hypothetical protein
MGISPPFVCQKCGRVATWDEAKAEGWLIKQRKGAPCDDYIIRCPDHITRYILKQVEDYTDMEARR